MKTNRMAPLILILMVCCVCMIGCLGNRAEHDSGISGSAPSRVFTSAQPEGSASHTPSSNTDYQNLKRHIDMLSQAMLHDDFETLADLTYPGLVWIMGGPAGMIEFLQRAKQEQKVQFLEVSLDDPEDIVVIDNRRFVLVPAEVKMRVGDVVLGTKSYQMGVSDDNGKTWTFLDIAGIDSDRKVLMALFGSTLDALAIPAVEGPVYYPD